VPDSIFRAVGRMALFPKLIFYDPKTSEVGQGVTMVLEELTPIGVYLDFYKEKILLGIL
jgi:hypothetical protein